MNTANETNEIDRLRKELKEVKATLADEVVAHRLDIELLRQYRIANGDDADSVKKNTGKLRLTR